MKIPFLEIYISTVDWQSKYTKLSLRHALPRDSKGRFKSKKDKMTNQLKAEVADLRKAGL